MKWAVLLMAYGGPDSLDDVEPYLLDVRGGRETPPELVEEIRERYAKIGGKSPLLGITRAQAAALESRLNAQLAGKDPVSVFVGMRHWRPTISEVVTEIVSSGYERIIALCMTPFASRMSTGAYAEKFHSALRSAAPQGTIEARMVEFWYDNPSYARAMKELVWAGINKFPTDARDNVKVIFTAHSLPAVLTQQGDPYEAQFKQAAAMVAQAANLSDGQWSTGYQSAGAQNGRWLGPSLEEMLNAIATTGQKHVLVAPIGFVSDHVEILYDIDIEAKQLAMDLGIQLERIDSPNTFPPFIETLANVIQRAVEDEAASMERL